jgi:hypothetical protein
MTAEVNGSVVATATYVGGMTRGRVANTAHVVTRASDQGRALNRIVGYSLDARMSARLAVSGPHQGQGAQWTMGCGRATRIAVLR